MRLTRLFGAALGTGFLFLAASSGAMAYDRWDRDHDRDHWRYEHDATAPRALAPRASGRGPRASGGRRARAPVFVAPQPMYMAPMMPQGPSGLNLNFNIPLN